MNIKIANSRPVAGHTLAQALALTLLTESGLQAAAKAAGTNVWAEYVKQALGIQAEIVAVPEDATRSLCEMRVSALQAFQDEVLAAITSQALEHLAHQLGLDRYTVSRSKNAPESNEKTAQARAVAKAGQYFSRIKSAWENDVLLADGISVGKLADAVKAAKAKVAADKPATLHDRMLSQAALVNAAAGLATRLDDAVQTALEKFLNRAGSIVTLAAQERLQAAQLDEITLELELVIEVAEPAIVALTGEGEPVSTEVMEQARIDVEEEELTQVA